MATVALIGTLDTKGDEYAWLRARLVDHGVEVVVVDVGSFSTSELADVGADEVVAAAGADRAGLRERRDRGETMAVMGAGAATVVRRLFDQGSLHGLLAVAGSGGSSVAAPAMQALPIGVPKLLVSTMASGDVSPVRRRGRRDADVLGRRRRRHQLGVRAGARQRGRGDRRDGHRLRDAGRSRAGRRRPAAGRSHHVRRHHRGRGRGPRAADRPRLRGAGVPRDRRGRAGHGEAGRVRAAGRGAATSPRPNWPTTWSAAC